MLMSILIKNATIITQNSKRETVHGDILIRNNRIERVAKRINEKAESVIDATGKLAMPGLINMHTHVSMTLFRGYGEGLPLDRWLKEKIWPIEAKQVPADAYVAAQLAIIEMIRCGTTTFCDMCLLGAKEIGEAAEKTGIRAHISQGLFDLLPGRSLKSELRLMEKTAYPAGKLTSFGIAPHSVYTCSEELLVAAKRFAKKRKRKLHIHASETRKEVFDLQKKTGKRPFEYLDSLGMVDPDSIFVHAGWVTKKEINLAAKKKLNIVTCPTSNLKLATGGICPVYEFDKAGANVCIGTDSAASNNSLNMFEAMKLTALLAKHRYWKADIFSANRTLDSGTLNPAAALGINAGRIEKGALADLILLDPGPNMTPIHDPIANVVYAANPANVTDVIINGKLIMENRKLKTVDEASTLKKAEELAKEIKRR